MRTFLALLIVLGASITASATSYATGEVAGHFGTPAQCIKKATLGGR